MPNTTEKVTMTVHIISMTRGETANSASPMWRCLTQEGERCNVFKHRDVVKDTFYFFEQAGYGDEMLAMQVDQRITWSRAPIQAELKRNGKWWEIAHVHKRPEGAIPDEQYKPDWALHRDAMSAWASAIIKNGDNVVVLDTETTGLTDQDQIIDIGITDIYGDEIYQSLVRPTRTDLLTSFVSNLTNIKPDDLLEAPDFAQVYEQIKPILGGKIWLIYNAPFDMGMLDRACNRAGLQPLRPIAVADVMANWAEWNGDWNSEFGHWNTSSLLVACSGFKINIDVAHRAVADAKLTAQLIHAISNP